MTSHSFYPEKLHRVKVPLWDTKKCKTIFLEDNPKSIVHEDMNLCAGEEGKDSCLVRSKAIFDNIFRNPCKVGTYNSLGGYFWQPLFWDNLGLQNDKQYQTIRKMCSRIKIINSTYIGWSKNFKCFKFIPDIVNYQFLDQKHSKNANILKIEKCLDMPISNQMNC